MLMVEVLLRDMLLVAGAPPKGCGRYRFFSLAGVLLCCKGHPFLPPMDSKGFSKGSKEASFLFYFSVVVLPYAV